MKLRELLILIVSLIGSAAFPMCTNGEPPLMEKNDAFPCSRGCPRGFECEFQDSENNMLAGICCANETALMQIYGNNERDEPVWMETELETSTVNSVIHVASPPGLRPPKGKTFPPPENEDSSNNYQNPTGITVTPDIVLRGPVPPSLPSSQSDKSEVSVQGENVTESPNESTTKSAESESSIVTAVENNNKDEESHSENKNKKTFFSEQSGENISEIELSKESDDSDETSVEDSQIRTEISLEDAKIEKNSTSNSIVNDLSNINMNEPAPEHVIILSSAETAENSTLAIDEEDVISSDQVVNSGLLNDTMMATVFPPTPKLEMNSEKNEQDSFAFSEGITKEEVQSNYSCERQKYKFSCHSGSIKTQPTLRWAWNADVGNCEFYPWGYCPGDRIVHSSTIRTKEECLQHCSTSTNSTESEHSEKAHRSQMKTFINNSEINTQETASEPQEKSKIKEHETNIDDVLPILAEDPAIVPVIAATDPLSESKSLVEPEPIKNEAEKKILTSTASNKEEIDGIFIAPESAEEEKVLCQETSYRYVCKSGMPSQFVYRWQFIDGKCRSFPYGYCWGEYNHSHPRSRVECQSYCKTDISTNYARVL